MNIKDLIGLNECTITSAPIVGEKVHVIENVNKCKKNLSIAGSRHSQGGHTVYNDTTMLLTETFNSVVLNSDNTVTVDAGATWNNVHQVLNPAGLSVPVQQSSPYFTVGGSISVNCHGRDPNNNPLCDYIVSLDIIDAEGALIKDVRYNGQHAELFKAVVGGYGSCGVIVSATLATCPNPLLRRQYKYFKTLEDYVELLDQRDKDNKQPQLHHAMLNFSAPSIITNTPLGTAADFFGEILGFEQKQKPNFFTDLFCVDYWKIADTDLPDPMPVSSLEETSWIANDALNIAWKQARSNNSFRGITWDLLKGYFAVVKTNYRNHWLREDVNFAAHLPSDSANTDMLQEYFVPRSNLVDFVGKLKKLLTENNVTVLNATLRIVRKEAAGVYLSYCPTQDMMCLAIDFKMDITNKKPSEDKANSWPAKAIQLAIDCKGSYYLPYYSFASLDQFKAAYPKNIDMKQAIEKFNGQRKLNNQFITKYLP